LESPDSSSHRTLIYIPIIHTLADMGALGASLERIKASTLGRKRLRRSSELVDTMWREIERMVDSFPVQPGRTRVYQDGLPVCGHELQIVSELAAAGGCNHKLVLRLHEKGAVIMGTESPELLVEEYQLATAAYNFPSAKDAGERRHLSARLLEKRDCFIADRIDATLQRGEAGILFVGMLHAVQRYLPPDMKILYPIRTH